MKFRQTFNEEKIWHKKVVIIETFHLLMEFKSPGWKIKDTAEFFNISLSYVSEDLKLAAAIRENENLKILSRNRALKRIR